jgi:hypothetical protein
MTKWVSLAILIAAVGATLHAQRMDVTRNGSQPAVNGPDENFTCHVVGQPLFGATEHTRASAGQVPFARARAEGQIGESTREATRTGLADARMRMSVNCSEDASYGCASSPRRREPRLSESA